MLVAAYGNFQWFAKFVYRVLVSELVDAGVFHFDSLAKNLVAFFKMSCSCLAIASSCTNAQMLSSELAEN